MYLYKHLLPCAGIYLPQSEVDHKQTGFIKVAVLQVFLAHTCNVSGQPATFSWWLQPRPEKLWQPSCTSNHSCKYYYPQEPHDDCQQKSFEKLAVLQAAFARAVIPRNQPAAASWQTQKQKSYTKPTVLPAVVASAMIPGIHLPQPPDDYKQKHYKQLPVLQAVSASCTVHNAVSPSPPPAAVSWWWPTHWCSSPPVCHGWCGAQPAADSRRSNNICHYQRRTHPPGASVLVVGRFKSHSTQLKCRCFLTTGRFSTN